MLVDLTVRNLALIEEARLSFGTGLNAITGETGAGKSLIVTGLELLLGERPKGGAATWVRTGAERAEVEGRFVVPEGPVTRRIDAFIATEMPSFEEEWREEQCLAGGAGSGTRGGPGTGERELLLARTLESGGRTRAWVNHRPVTRRALGELASMLVEIHGQNTHQRLLEPEHQRELLDAALVAAGGAGARARRDYASARRRWLELALEVDERIGRRRERRERLEFVRFQVGELESLALEDGEVDRLRAERARLRHASGLERDLRIWLDVLSEGDEPALDRLRGAARGVEDWSDKVVDLADAAEELAAAQVHLEEATALLVSFADGVELDPRRLEQVEGRLAEAERLASKHGVEPDGLRARFDALAAEARDLEESEEGLAELSRSRDEAFEVVRAEAAKLTRARRRQAPKLAKAVRESLASLGLADATFLVQVEELGAPDRGADGQRVDEKGGADDLAELRVQFSRSGGDHVAFLLAANAGEPPRPLRHVASGGEAARIMLALRTALAGCEDPRSLVFDEIDTGVGGRLGPELGQHLRALGEHHQVLAVTHLPAIAASGHRHLVVRKAVRRGRTRTAIALLEGAARVEEVADMIAGGAEQATAQAEARRLIEAVAV